jgi:hypothetical protein
MKINNQYPKFDLQFCPHSDKLRIVSTLQELNRLKAALIKMQLL